MPEPDEEQPRSGSQRYVLKLYVTGASRRSQRAIRNLNEICEQFLAGQYDLAIIDLYQFPDSARKAGVLAAPTLVREMPSPVRRLIGDLSQKDRVLLFLDLEKS